MKQIKFNDKDAYFICVLIALILFTIFNIIALK